MFLSTRPVPGLELGDKHTEVEDPVPARKEFLLQRGGGLYPSVCLVLLLGLTGRRLCRLTQQEIGTVP